MSSTKLYTVPLNSVSRIALSPRLLSELNWKNFPDGSSCWVLLRQRGELLCAPEGLQGGEEVDFRHPFQSLIDYSVSLQEDSAEDVTSLPQLERLLVRWRLFKVGMAWSGTQMHLKLGKGLIEHLGGSNDARVAVAVPIHGILSLSEWGVAQAALVKPITELFPSL
ncbi:MAG: hypothetical protein WD081_01925 [Gammaproteobacteria bacterium]